jgi:hypothetical protein
MSEGLSDQNPSSSAACREASRQAFSFSARFLSPLPAAGSYRLFFHMLAAGKKPMARVV